MRVVAMIRPAQRQTLERELRDFADLEQCATRTECERTVMIHNPDALVVDPELLDNKELEGFTKLLRDAQLPIIFYFSLNSHVLEPVLDMVADEPTDVLLAEIEDEGHRIRQILSHLPAISTVGKVFSALASMLRGLPPGVRTALAAVLLDPKWSSAKELPLRAQVSRRTIDRALQSAGYAPLHKWCAIARLVRACAVVRDSSASISDAARSAGYDSPRSLRRAADTILRADWGELCAMPAEMFAAKVTAILAQR